MFDMLFGVKINNIIEIIKMSNKAGYEHGEALAYVKDMSDRIKILEKTLNIKKEH